MSTQLTARKEILINVTRKQAGDYSVVSSGSGCDHVSDFTITCMFATQVLIAELTACPSISMQILNQRPLWEEMA